MFDDIRTHAFRDKVFRIMWRRWRRAPDEEPGQNLGRCEHREDSRPQMHIFPSKDPLELLGTVIHESVHAGFSDIDNDAVGDWEKDLVRLLRRMKIKVTFGDE